MSITEPKQGRGRQYCLPPVAGFANGEMAAMVAGLDELLARHRDLIEDLPGEALTLLPPGFGNHLAWLTRHLAEGDCNWLSKLAEREPPADLREALRSDADDRSAAALLALCDRVREEVTKPILAPIADLERSVVAADGRVLTPRGVVQHLLWHWTYHGGQCGILRRLTGHTYRWSFAPRGLAPAGNP